MGMYTELIFGASLKPDTPPEIINTIYGLISDDSTISCLTIEDLGWERNPLKGNSYSFAVSESHTLFKKDSFMDGSYILSTRSNIKNYWNDIEKFLDWIKPYIESGSGHRDFYAIVTYEESDPEIYYLKNKNRLIV